MKKRKIIEIVGTAAMLICLAVAFVFMLFVMKRQNNLYRIETQLSEEAAEYLQKEVSDFNIEEWDCVGGVMTGKDKEIEKQNAKKSSEDYVYPYSNVEFTFEKKSGSFKSRNIVVRFEKNQNGELEIVGYRYEARE